VNPFTAVNEEADALGQRRVPPPPDMPGERDYARLSRRRPDVVMCGFAPLDRPRAECKGELARIDQDQKLMGSAGAMTRLTLDLDVYRRDRHGNWVPGHQRRLKDGSQGGQTSYQLPRSDDSAPPASVDVLGTTTAARDENNRQRHRIHKHEVGDEGHPGDKEMPSAQ